MSSNSNNLPRASRRIQLCYYCDYYPATESCGTCPYCVHDHLASVARREHQQRLQEAQRIAEQEAARVLAEQRKREFDQMVINSARKPGISFADVLKNKK